MGTPAFRPGLNQGIAMRLTPSGGRVRAFDLDAPVLKFNRFDSISWRDMPAALVLGDPGSGKTTGALMALTRAALRAGASVVHTCVKPGDAQAWEAVAHEEGVGTVVFRFGKHSFNPLAWEQFREPARDSGRLAEALTQLALTPLLRQRRGEGGGGGGGDAFWLADGARFVRHVATLFVLAGTPLSFEAVAESLQNLPSSIDETHDLDWQARCPAYAALLAAEARLSSDVATTDPSRRADLERSARFLLRDAPLIPFKTRASTVATVVSSISPYLSGLVGRTINAPEGSHVESEQSLTPFNPRRVVERPCAVVLDLPLQVWGESGAIVQRLALSAIQRSVLTRDPRGTDHPVVLVMDECQEFLDPVEDAMFMRTARDRGGVTVLATQCVGNLTSACSSAREPRAAAETIMGLPTVKLFGATSDPETLDYASRVFTQTPQPRFSVSTSGEGPVGSDGKGARDRARGRGSRPPTGTVSIDLQPDVPPHEIARLKRGGPKNNFHVEMFCAVTGRVWKVSGRPSLKVVIRQSPPAARSKQS